MIKHIGRHGDKKVVVLYKTVPDQDHMCLVCYSDLMPRLYHDAVMQVLETPEGQSANELAEALHRNLLPDGRNILITLHKEGLIKRVPTNQVIITPTAKSSVRLDELNGILKKMQEGSEAVRQMAEIDAQAGLRDPKKSAALKETASQPTALSDQSIAQGMRDQALRMQAEAQALITESQRLLDQAAQLAQPTPQVNETTKPTTKTRRKKVAAA
jgi:hypothetical protein